MTYRKIALLFALCCAASVGLGACTASPRPDLDTLLLKRGYKVGPSVDRIPNYRVGGFSALDDQHLILDDGPSSRYLITLQTQCPGLRSTERLGFTSLPSGLSKFDKVVVNDAAFDQHCPISSIQTLDREQKGVQGSPVDAQ